MSDSKLWNEIGKIYQKMGSPVEAIAAYSRAIELDPDSGWSYCNLGHVYFMAGEFGNALFLFRKSIQLMDTPENQALVWNKIGDTYRALKDIDHAIQAYKKADNLDMGASHSESKENRQSSNNDNRREMVKTEKTVKESINRSSVSSIRATNNENSMGGQNIDKGINPFENGIGYREKNQLNNQQKGASSFSTYPEKELSPELSASLPSNQPRAAIIQGMEEKKPSHSLEETTTIPDSFHGPNDNQHVDPAQSKPVQIPSPEQTGKQVEILEEKANIQKKTTPNIENLEEILAKVNIYENITRVNPTSDRAWDTLGKLYKSLGRYMDAINAYQKAIELTPDKEVYHYYLGLLYAVEQQHDDAIRAFLFVLHKNPDYVLAHSALAGIYHRMGLENKANHHIAIALPKMNNESAYNRACFYAICGDTELALEFLRLALSNQDTTIEWIKSDPDLDPIRTDQRFQELIYGQDPATSDKSKGNLFSSELKGSKNRLLPILNNSLAR